MRDFAIRFSDIGVLHQQLLADELKQYQAPVKWWQRMWRSMLRRFKNDADNLLDYIPTLDVNRIIGVPKSAFGAASPAHRQFTKTDDFNRKTLADAVDTSALLQQIGRDSRNAFVEPEVPLKSRAMKTMEMCEIVVDSDARQEKVGVQHQDENAASLSGNMLSASVAVSSGEIEENPAIKFGMVTSASKDDCGINRLEASGIMLLPQAKCPSVQSAARSAVSVGNAQASKAASVLGDSVAAPISLAHAGISFFPRNVASHARKSVPVPHVPPRSRSPSRLQGLATETSSAIDNNGFMYQEHSAVANVRSDFQMQNSSVVAQSSSSSSLSSSVASLDVPKAPPRSRSRSRLHIRSEASFSATISEPALESLEVHAGNIQHSQKSMNSFLVKWGSRSASSVASPVPVVSGVKVFDGAKGDLDTSVGSTRSAADAETRQSVAAYSTSSPENARSKRRDER